MSVPLLEARRLGVDFAPPGGRTLRAVADVDLVLGRGETLALLGESGCGKTTCGRALLQLLRPTRGEVLLDGQPLVPLWRRRLGRWRWSGAPATLRRRLQPVFQDPAASLDPRLRVRQILDEPLDALGVDRGAARPARVAALLTQVGLPPALAARLPHALSGGQRQRLAIARSLAVRPDVLVADEPTAALDVSVQAQILALLWQLQRDHGLAYVLISHDLAAVRALASQVAVMYLGRVVERAPAAAFFAGPRHPYAQALRAAVPDPGRVAARPPPLAGEAPSPIAPPPGCPFHPRCPAVIARCRHEAPALRAVAPGHLAACHVAGP